MQWKNTGAHSRLCASVCREPTRGRPDPGQAQNPVVKVSVSEDVGQAVVVMLLFRVQLQKLLHANVRKAKGIVLVQRLNRCINLNNRK